MFAQLHGKGVFHHRQNEPRGVACSFLKEAFLTLLLHCISLLCIAVLVYYFMLRQQGGKGNKIGVLVFLGNRRGIRHMIICLLNSC